MWSSFLIIIGSKLRPQFFIIMKRLFLYKIFLFGGSIVLIIVKDIKILKKNVVHTFEQALKVPRPFPHLK